MALLRSILGLCTFMMAAQMAWGSEASRQSVSNQFFSLGGESAFQFMIPQLLDPHSDTIQILDTHGLPVADATILIGWAPGLPFDGNVLTTDAEGKIRAPEAWNSPLPLTITSADHTIKTILDASPDDPYHHVKAKEGPMDIQLSGETDGFGRLRRDGRVDFGLILPGYTPAELLNFNVASVISPETDTIVIAGREFEIPSNLTLPDQRESYFIPIRFNKPDFRTFVRSPGTHRFIASHGRFPLRQVIDKFRSGESVLDVVNDFTFLEAGIHQVEIDSNGSSQNMSVNDIQLDGQAAVRAPQFSSSHSMVSVSMAEIDGYMYPTDIKRVLSDEVQLLQTIESADAKKVLSILRQGQSEDLTNEETDLNQLSFSIGTASASRSAKFLPLVHPPELEESTNRVQLDPPTLPEDLSVLGMVLLVSEIESVQNGKIKTEKSQKIWEVYQRGWTDEVDLPQVEWSRRSDREYRLEVLYLATDNQDSTNWGAIAIEEVTHVSRNALDL